MGSVNTHFSLSLSFLYLNCDYLLHITDKIWIWNKVKYYYYSLTYIVSFIRDFLSSKSKMCCKSRKCKLEARGRTEIIMGQCLVNLYVYLSCFNSAQIYVAGYDVFMNSELLIRYVPLPLPPSLSTSRNSKSVKSRFLMNWYVYSGFSIDKYEKDKILLLLLHVFLFCFHLPYQSHL